MIKELVRPLLISIVLLSITAVLCEVGREGVIAGKIFGAGLLTLGLIFFGLDCYLSRGKIETKTTEL